MSEVCILWIWLDDFHATHRAKIPPQKKKKKKYIYIYKNYT